ncbi:MAG TPA: YfjI family protein [Planctomycetota bacterium]|nr:YfjI family protein [Planctomycetota bacterium]
MSRDALRSGRALETDRVVFLGAILGTRPSSEAVVRVALNTPPGSGVGPGKWSEASFPTVEAAAAHLSAHAETGETYAALALFAPGASRKAEHVVARRWVSADVDDKAMPGATPEERHARARELARAITAGHVLVDSGRGYHVHLLLPEAERVEAFADLADGRRRLAIVGRALRLYFESKARDLFGQPVHLDHCHGPERVWRVPPGVNAKSATEAKVLTAQRSTWRAVRLVSPAAAESIADIAPADLSFLAPFISAAEDEEDLARRPAREVGVANAASFAEFDPSMLPERWRVGWPHDRGDPSSIDFAVAVALFEAGYGVFVARAAIAARRARLTKAADRAKGAREDYLARTVANAWAKARVPLSRAPLLRDRAPFPLAALPPTVRRYVEEAAAAVGCEPSMIALPALVSLASAIGNTRRVRLKVGWEEPAVLWGAIVGESGTLKSPALDAALGPIQSREARVARTHEALLSKYAADSDRYARDRIRWLKSKGDGDPPEKPRPPALPRHIVSDTTIEALATRLQENPRGLLLARDELSGWLRSFDAYRPGNRGGDAARWLEMHRAGILVVDRKTDERRMVRVARAAMSIVGTIQPDVLRRALGPEHFEDGLAARLLLTMPPARRRRWTEEEVSPATAEAVERVFDRLLDLRCATDPDGEPVPLDLPLTPEAMPVWIAFMNEHGTEGEGLVGASAAAWAKAEGYAARLALVIHLARWAAADDPPAPPDAVDAESLAAGVRLARWFADEAERVYVVLGESSADRDRRRLAEWIASRGGRVTVRDLSRGPRAYRGDEERAERALADLVGSGLGTWEDVSSTPAGGRPTRAFRLGPETALGGDGDETSGAPQGERGVPSPSPVSSASAGDPADAQETAAVGGNGEAAWTCRVCGWKGAWRARRAGDLRCCRCHPPVPGAEAT